MNIADILKEKASECGHAEAILMHRRDRWQILKGKESASVSYAELYEKTCDIAEQFEKMGLKKGDVILVATAMSPELYAVLLATFQIGATAMFIDIAQGAKHLDTCLSIVKPQAIVASWKFCLATLLTERTRAIPFKFQLGHGLLPGFHVLRDKRKTSFDTSTCREIQALQVPVTHPALITFTSGSTGTPKAIVRSHGFLLTQLRVLSTHTSSSTNEPTPKSSQTLEHERELVTLPIFVLANLASGITSVIPNADLKKPGLFDEQPVVEQIESLRPSRVTASPAFLERLCTFAMRSNLTFPTVKDVFTGGGPVFPKTLDAAMTVFPNADIQTVYGSTEAEPISLTSARRLSLDDRTKMLNGAGLLVGKPISEIEVKIVSQTSVLDGKSTITQERWEELTETSDVGGEILVAGDHVIPGYLNGHGDAETKVNVEGRIWHRTGDAGYIDSAGRLWLLGRHGNRIANDRGLLFPFQVESVAKAQPGVSAAALVESESEFESKRILVLECRSRRKGRRIALALKTQLSWAHIDDVVVVRKIPMDKRHNSKVVYDRLKRQLHIA